LDGYDEISLTGDTRIISIEGEKIMRVEVPGKSPVAAPDIHGSATVEEAAGIF
jgi:anthranilate phosphoribosyltransferase